MAAKDEIPTGELLLRLQDEIRETLRKVLTTRAVSLSPHEAKRTGNRYQPVRLGDTVLAGFRSAERPVFAGLTLKNKRVIDLGCNLGEFCREAVRRGAASARGIEFDPYFIQVARYAVAYEGLNDIAFQQGDLTEPDVYHGQYDIVLALSVHAYVKTHLARIAAMTKGVFVLETHGVDADWQMTYLDDLRQHFPFVALVGFTDHKRSKRNDVRYLLFASRNKLDGVIAQRARDLAGVAQPFSIDTTRSTVAHYDAFLAAARIGRGVALDQLIEATLHAWPELETDAVVADVAERGLVGAPSYWASFVIGLAQFRAERAMTHDNLYGRTFRALIAAGLYRGALKTLFETDPERAQKRLALRFTMLRRIRTGAQFDAIDPVILFSPVADTTDADPRYGLHVAPLDRTCYPLALDGHHRLFCAYALGATAVPCLPIWYPECPPVRNALARFPDLEASGWAAVPLFSEALTAS